MEDSKMTGRNTKGLLMVYTGDGKGKTTSAIGMAMRAAGHGMRVCFVQFIKGSWKYGEMNAIPEIKELADLVTEMRPLKHPYEQGVLAQKGVEY